MLWNQSSVNLNKLDISLSSQASSKHYFIFCLWNLFSHSSYPIVTIYLPITTKRLNNTLTKLCHFILQIHMSILSHDIYQWYTTIYSVCPYHNLLRLYHQALITIIRIKGRWTFGEVYAFIDCGLCRPKDCGLAIGNHFSVDWLAGRLWENITVDYILYRKLIRVWEKW